MIYWVKELLSRKKLQGIPKCKPPQFEEREQGSEPLSDMAGILELSDQELNTTMINMLMAPTDKVDYMQEHIGNVGKEVDIPGKK